MRLDKLLCDTLHITRSEAKNIIKSGKVSLNGNVTKDIGIHVNPKTDVVTVNGNTVTYEQYVYYMLNKPSGFVSATKDSKDKTVIDLFKAENRDDLFPVGRLDKDTVGLLIITNDGDFSHHITSPRHHVPKTYQVKCKDPISDDELITLETGVEIKGDGITKEAKTQRIAADELYLTISEGMYHQVKRMIAAVGNEVIYLKRISIGDVCLDQSLSEGSYRRLSEDEVNLLKNKE